MMTLESVMGSVGNGDVKCCVILAVSLAAASRTFGGADSSCSRLLSCPIVSAPHPCPGCCSSQWLIAAPAARRAQTRAMPSLPASLARRAVSNSTAILSDIGAFVTVLRSRYHNRNFPSCQ